MLTKWIHYFCSDIFGLIRQPPNFGAYLLSIFIANLLMYLIYYSLMKVSLKFLNIKLYLTYILRVSNKLLEDFQMPSNRNEL